MKNTSVDLDIQKEYNAQKIFLENSQNSLRRRLEREREAHKQDNINIMKENIKLLKMIGDLRAEVKKLSVDEKASSIKLKLAKKGFKLNQQLQPAPVLNPEEIAQREEEREQKREYIDNLRDRLLYMQ